MKEDEQLEVENRVLLSLSVCPDTKRLLKRLAKRENNSVSRVGETLMLEAVRARSQRATKNTLRKKTPTPQTREKKP